MWSVARVTRLEIVIIIKCYFLYNKTLALLPHLRVCTTYLVKTNALTL